MTMPTYCVVFLWLIGCSRLVADWSLIQHGGQLGHAGVHNPNSISANIWADVDCATKIVWLLASCSTILLAALSSILCCCSLHGMEYGVFSVLSYYVTYSDLAMSYSIRVLVDLASSMRNELGQKMEYSWFDVIMFMTIVFATLAEAAAAWIAWRIACRKLRGGPEASEGLPSRRMLAQAQSQATATHGGIYQAGQGRDSMDSRPARRYMDSHGVLHVIPQAPGRQDEEPLPQQRILLLGAGGSVATGARVRGDAETKCGCGWCRHLGFGILFFVAAISVLFPTELSSLPGVPNKCLQSGVPCKTNVPIVMSDVWWSCNHPHMHSCSDDITSSYSSLCCCNDGFEPDEHGSCHKCSVDSISLSTAWELRGGFGGHLAPCVVAAVGALLVTTLLVAASTCKSRQWCEPSHSGYVAI